MFFNIRDIYTNNKISRIQTMQNNENDQKYFRNLKTVIIEESVHYILYFTKFECEYKIQEIFINICEHIFESFLFIEIYYLKSNKRKQRWSKY